MLAIWQLTCCHSVSQPLFRLFPTQDPLKACSWSWWLPTAANCWGQENSPVSLLPASPFQISEEWDGWQWCWGRAWGTAVTPAWGKKSQTHPPGPPVCPSPLVCLCLSPSERRSAVLLGGMDPADLEPCSLCRSYGRPPHHKPHCAPRPQHSGVSQAVPPAASGQWLHSQLETHSIPSASGKKGISTWNVQKKFTIWYSFSLLLTLPPTAPF